LLIWNIAIELFTNTADILNSIVSDIYYGMLRGHIHTNLLPETIEFKMAAASIKRSIHAAHVPL